METQPTPNPQFTSPPPVLTLHSVLSGKQSVFCPKVLFYFPDFGALGGIQRYILHVATALKQNGRFEPVVACSLNTPFYHQLQQAGIRTYGVPTLPVFKKPLLRMLDLPTMLQLKNILDREKPDLVHVHIGQLENLFFKRQGYPLVYTFHGYSSLYSLSATLNPVKRFLKRLLQPLFTGMVSQLDAMLFVSEAEQYRMEQEGYLPQGFTGQVIYNGLPIDDIREQAKATDIQELRDHLGIPQDAYCISMISRLDQNKNPLTFLKLAERLSQEPNLPPLHFLIAGTGPMEAELRKTLQDSPLWADVHLLGHRDDVPALLALSDLNIQLSLMEGFGLGVLEAMAVGTPCFAYATGGIPEIMDLPESEFLLAPTGDFEALTQKAIRLLQLTPRERSILGERLQQRAQFFDISRMMEQLEAVYAEILWS